MENSNNYKVTIVEWLVFVLILVFGLEELLSCVAIKLGSSFDVYYKQSLVVVGMTVVTLVLFVVINFFRYIKNRDKIKPISEKSLSRYNPYMWGLVVVLVILSIISLWCVKEYTGNDLTIEYMNSIQMRMPLFSSNPLTGTKLKYGIYPKYKLVALPYFYACVERFLGMQGKDIIYLIVPTIVLLIYVAICYQIGKQFYPESKGRILIFLISVLILLLTGDKWRYTASHGLLHEGWKGSTIVGCVIIPFLALAGHRLVRYKQRVYGLIAILLSIIAILFCRKIGIPTLWMSEPREFGHQAGIYLGALVVLLAIRQKYPTENKVRDGGILFAFTLTMIFPYNGLMYPAIAYVCCQILESMGKYSSKQVVVVGGIVTFLLAGTILPFRSGYEFRNESQIDIDIAESIRQVKCPVLVGPNEIVEKARMTTGCKTPYGKNIWISKCGIEVADVVEETETILYENINKIEKDAGIIGLLAKTSGCNVFYATDDMFALTGQEAWDSEDPELKRELLLETLASQGWEKYIDRDDYCIFIRRKI